MLESYKSIKDQTKIDTLPDDLIWTILSYLDSRALLSYFSSSRSALLSAEKFPSWQPLYLYTKAFMHKTKVQDIVVSAYYEFDDSNYIEFESLLLWVQDMDCLARTLRVRLLLNSKTLHVLSTKSLVEPSPLGHRRLTIRISSTVVGFKVYTILVRGKNYVSGLQGIPYASCKPIGDCRGSSYDIYFNPNNIDSLGFIVDALGIRSLRLGDSEWSSGTPFKLNCFEGLSIANTKGDKELIVLADVSLCIVIYRTSTNCGRP